MEKALQISNKWRYMMSKRCRCIQATKTKQITMDSLTITKWDDLTGHMGNFSQGTLGGISRPSTTDRLRSNASTPFAGRSVKVVENPEDVKSPIVVPIPLAPLRDDSQKHYVEGDILFCPTISATVKEGRVPCISIWKLNHGFEEAFRDRLIAERASLQTGRDRKRRSEATDSSFFPTTLEDFVTGWSFAGVMQTDMSQANSDNRFRLVGAAIARYVRLPNLWGDVKVNSRIGLWIGERRNDLTSFYDISGQAVDEATQGTFLRIEPMAVSGLDRYPPFLTGDANGNPVPGRDICYWGPLKPRNTISYTRDPLTGLLRTDQKPNADDYIIIPEFKEGRYIELGVVTEVGGRLPTASESRMAMRSHVHWKLLSGKSWLDVEITPVGEVPLFR
jgi:hypothetical protein